MGRSLKRPWEQWNIIAVSHAKRAGVIQNWQREERNTPGLYWKDIPIGLNGKESVFLIKYTLDIGQKGKFGLYGNAAIDIATAVFNEYRKSQIWKKRMPNDSIVFQLLAGILKAQ